MIERIAQEEDVSPMATSTMTNSELPSKQVSLIMELSLFLTMIGITLSSTAISNIVLYRSCVHSLHYSVEECRPFLSPERSNETKHLELEVQKYVTYVSTVKTMFESLMPAVLCLFLGVWSETYGRKPLIIWPLFGRVFSGILAVIYSMMDSLGPWWTIVMIIPSSLTGSISVLITGICCSLSDITSQKSRSIRMITIEIAVAVGSVLGSLACSYLLKAVGNVYVLLIAATIFVIAYSVADIWLQESLSGAMPGSLSSVFDIKLVKEMITECFKRRPNYLRAQIHILTAAYCLNVFILYGMAGLEYMYTRNKLHWALKDFNQFSSINVILVFVGSFLSIAVLQKRLKVSDLVVSAISFGSSAGAYAIKTFAVTSWDMYLASVVSSFGSLSTPLIRSFLTKILPVEDITKVFALMCALEGIFPLLSPVVYNSLYNVTISSFPGSIMLMTSFVYAVCVILLLVVIRLRWKSPTVSYQPVESGTADS